jgi:hypothetical protein
VDKYPSGKPESKSISNWTPNNKMNKIPPTQPPPTPITAIPTKTN